MAVIKVIVDDAVCKTTWRYTATDVWIIKTSTSIVEYDSFHVQIRSNWDYQFCIPEQSFACTNRISCKTGADIAKEIATNTILSSDMEHFTKWNGLIFKRCCNPCICVNMEYEV